MLSSFRLFNITFFIIIIIITVQALTPKEWVIASENEPCKDPYSEKNCEQNLGGPPHCVCLCKLGFARDSSGKCSPLGPTTEPIQPTAPHCNDPNEVLMCWPCMSNCQIQCNYYMCVCKQGYSRSESGSCQPWSPYVYNNNQPIPAPHPNNNTNKDFSPWNFNPYPMTFLGWLKM